MRIAALHLDRYGPFTDRSLDFRDGAALTVVHGANEAGKTCALKGLEDALYGIPHITRLAFLHDHSAMRVGATLTCSDGRRIDFRRRKARERTLLDPAGSLLPDDALAPFLGRVDRTLFLQAFGLDSERLRQGAKALTQGEGSLGEALIAAAPGLGRLTDLRRQLAEEAARLFTERRSAGKPFYTALDAWDDARRRVQAATVTADRIARAETAVAAAAETVARLTAERRDLKTREVALRRIAAAIPRLAAIDALAARLAECPDVPAVDEAFAIALDKASDVLRRAGLERDVLIREREPILAARALVTIPVEVLAAAAAIDRVAGLAAKRLSADGERIEAETRLVGAVAALEDAAARLGLADVETMIGARPSVVALSRVRSLAAERVRIDAERAAATKALESAEEQRRRADRESAAAAHLVDPRDLRARIDALAGLRAASIAAEQADAARQTAAARLADALMAAGRPADEGVAVRGRRLPDRAAVEAHGARLDELERRLDAARRRRADAAERAGAADARLADLCGDGALPDDETVRGARRERDDAVASVRSILLMEREATAGERLGAMHALDRTIAAADGIADSRAGAADRIAAVSAARAAFTDARKERTTAEGDEREAAAALEAERARWSGLLAAHGLPVMEAASALSVLDTQRTLVTLADQLETTAQDARLATAERDRMIAALVTLAEDTGLTEGTGEPGGLLAVVRDRIEAMGVAWSEARGRAASLAEVAESAAGARRVLDALDTDADAWALSWSEAVQAIGLAPSSGVAEAEAAVSVWLDVGVPIAAREEVRRVAERLRLENEAFDVEVRRLATLLTPVAPDDLPTPEMAHRLSAALATARKAETESQSLDARITRLDHQLARTAAEIEAAATRIDELAALAGAPSGTDLAALVAGVRETRALRARIDGERDALLDETGRAEADLRAEAAGADRDGAAALLDEIAAKLAALDGEIEAAIRVHADACHERDSVAAEEGAEAAGQEEQNALARIAEIAEDWRVLQAASRIVGAAIEDFRNRHQNPVLDEASRLFSGLTGGRYSGLAADYGDDGRPILRVVCEDGRHLDTDALSEGTSDQLFLALRLATLIDHAGRSEPLPFVGDDLFITFDEERTAAGLEALAGFGATVQAIMFTHHEHVAAIASERLGNRVDVIRI